MNFDILIIGGGPAGITLAKHLAEKLKIGIIEKGDLKYNNKINLKITDTVQKYGNYPFENYSTNFSSVNYFGGNSLVWKVGQYHLMQMKTRRGQCLILN